ncbi:MAG: DUF6794 domain-containing protein [Paludibacteraceae bacterium]|nr:DUF6794 domain-containing protein [Paludibacteraceae bacterium]
MKTKNIIIILLSLHSLLSSAYEKRLADYPIPRNIKGCIKLLDKTMSADEKELIRTLPEDSICKHEKFRNKDADFYETWLMTDSTSKLEKYFVKKEIYKYYQMYETILVSYHRYLNNLKINLKEQKEKYAEKRKAASQEQITTFAKYEKDVYKSDTIDCVYIPMDLDDCCVQLDQLLSEEDKEYIKGLPKEDVLKHLHFGLGMWIRNNWGLWGGSRLQKYLFDISDHPDGMSSIILKYYYDWLNKER